MKTKRTLRRSIALTVATIAVGSTLALGTVSSASAITCGQHSFPVCVKSKL